jgi:hypothetical protein
LALGERCSAAITVFVRVGPFLNVFTEFCMMRKTDSPYDYQREAQTAMSMALAATGNDRQDWVRVALSWQYLARNAAERGRACGSVQERPLASCLNRWGGR